MLESKDDCHDGGDGDNVGAEEKWGHQTVPDDDVPALAVSFQLAEVGAARGFLDAPAAQVAIPDGEIAQGTQKPPALIARVHSSAVRVEKAGGFLGVGDGLGRFTDRSRATPGGEEVDGQPGLTARAFAQCLKWDGLRGEPGGTPMALEVGDGHGVIRTQRPADLDSSRSKICL